MIYLTFILLFLSFIVKYLSFLCFALLLSTNLRRLRNILYGIINFNTTNY